MADCRAYLNINIHTHAQDKTKIRSFVQSFFSRILLTVTSVQNSTKQEDTSKELTNIAESYKCGYGSYATHILYTVCMYVYIYRV